MKKRIVLLIPCYNEEITIKKVIQKAKKIFNKEDIYVGDNNSTDKTANIAQEELVNVIVEKNIGKGNMLKSMLKQIQSDYYVMIDGDDTYYIEDIPKMLELAKRENADLVIGNRLKNNNYDKCDKNKIYTIGNKLGNLVINLRYRAKIEDVMSGLRIMSKKMIESWNIKSEGFEIETEMTVFALKNNYKISQIPIGYKNRPEGSKSKLKTIKDGFKLTKAVLKM